MLIESILLIEAYLINYQFSKILSWKLNIVLKPPFEDTKDHTLKKPSQKVLGADAKQRTTFRRTGNLSSRN